VPAGATAPAGATSPADAAALLFVITLWGGSFVASKVALRELTPMAAALARYILAAVAFVPIAIGYRRRGFIVGRRELATFIPLALLAVTTYFWVQYTALEYTSAVNVCLVVATAPVFAAILGRVVLAEPVGGRAAAGIATALVGTALVATGGRLVPDLAGGWRDLVGIGLGLVNALAWGTNTVLGRKAMGRYPPLFATAWITILGTAMMLPIVVATGDLRVLPRLLGSPPALLAVGYLGLLCSALGYGLWCRALSRTRAAVVASFQYVQPLVTAILAWLILGEAVGIHTVIGGVVIIGGLYLVNRPATPLGRPAGARRGQRARRRSGRGSQTGTWRRTPG